MKLKVFTIVLAVMVLSAFAAFSQESESSDNAAVSSSQSKKALTDKEIKFKETVLVKKGINPADDWEMEKLWKGYLGMGITGAVVGGGLFVAGAAVFGALFPKAFEYDHSKDKARTLYQTYSNWYHETTGKYPQSYGTNYDPTYSLYYYLYQTHNNTSSNYMLGVIGAPVIGGILMLSGIIITPVLCYIGFSRMQHTASVYRKTTGQRLFSFFQRTNISGGYDWERKELNVAMAIKL